MDVRVLCEPGSSVGGNHSQNFQATEFEEVLRVDDQEVDPEADRRHCGRIDRSDDHDIGVVDADGGSG